MVKVLIKKLSPSGNATDNPVATRQDLPGSKLIGFSIKAIKSMPEAPLVLYDGKFTEGLNFLIKTRTISLNDL